MNRIVTGGVIEKDGKFLLVQEAQEGCRGKWNLPAGKLDPKESIFEAAKREVYEETGCKVELEGIASISNRISEDNTFIGIIFSTKLVQESIKINEDEILDVKWFSYEEILNMKDELRSYNLIVTAIDAVKYGNTYNLDLIKVFE